MSQGRKAEGDIKIYRHKAHREHLRKIPSREGNSEIRESSSNEEKRVLPGERERKKEWMVMKGGHIGKSWMNFLLHTHFFLLFIFSPLSGLFFLINTSR